MTKYQIGFLFSILLTLAAFGAVAWHIHSGHTFPTHEQVRTLLVVLALTQLVVQLIFFLHIGRETNRWNIAALSLAIILIFFVVGGTLWIMGNLMHGQVDSGFMNEHIDTHDEMD